MDCDHEGAASGCNQSILPWGIVWPRSFFSHYLYESVPAIFHSTLLCLGGIFFLLQLSKTQFYRFPSYAGAFPLFSSWEIFCWWISFPRSGRHCFVFFSVHYCEKEKKYMICTNMWELNFACRKKGDLVESYACLGSYSRSASLLLFTSQQVLMSQDPFLNFIIDFDWVKDLAIFQCDIRVDQYALDFAAICILYESLLFLLADLQFGDFGE